MNSVEKSWDVFRRAERMAPVFLLLVVVSAGCGKGELFVPRGTGTINIISEPQGAVITFDGTVKGWAYEKKPIVIKGATNGWHTIRASLPGRVPRVEEVDLEGGEITVRIPLDPQAFGRLTIYSDPPGAEVFVDSRFFGTANPKIEINSLSYGEHILWMRLKGYQSERHNVIVERQIDRAYRVHLKKE